MKRLIAALSLVVMLIILLAGCQDSNLQKEYDELSGKYEKLQNDYNGIRDKYAELQHEYDSLESNYDDLLTDYATLRVDFDIINNTTGTSNSNKGETVTNQSNEEGNALCYEDEFVTIYYSHCEPNYDEYNIVLIVENKTDVNIKVGLRSFAVDGWNLSDAFCFQDITRNSKGYVKIGTKELKTTTPDSISGTLYLADASETLFGEFVIDVSFADISVS
nr:MAG TPA: protein of unknown function (DUF4969) [Caudoviricetes sp.]